MPDLDELRKQVEELRRRMEADEEEKRRLREENRSLLEKTKRLEKENQLLRQKIEKFIKYHYGHSRNEGIDPKQLELLLQGLSPVVEMPTGNSPTDKPSGRRKGASRPMRRVLLESNLPIEEVILQPEEVLQDPEGWRQISEERSWQLDWQAPRIIRRVFIRPRYVRKERFAIAPLPPQPIDKGMVGPGLLAQILVNKYEYHLPLYRQEMIFSEQHGVELNRKTMGAWVEQAAELLQPIYRAMRDGLVAGTYLQADETPIRYLDPDIKGKSQQGWLWVYGRPGSDVVFEWRTDRSRAGPLEFLENFRGKLQTDGYSAYESLARARPDLELVGCWAHARRGLHEALSENRLSAWLIGQVGLLYGVEKRLRESKAGPGLRQAVRAAQSQPILDRLHKAMIILRVRALPQGLLGRAIDYILPRWDALTRFVQDGSLQIDNNLLENSIRPSALGKRNWLFIGHPEAGWRSAVIYSLLGSCRRHGLNPYEYLQDVLARFPAAKNTQVHQFVPSAWLKKRRQFA